MIKITSERCELVKLCDINCSGPVFLRHTVIILYITPYRSKIQRWSDDRELNQARSKPNTVDRPVRTARTFVHH